MRSENQAQVLAPVCMTLSKSHNLSESQCVFQWNGNTIACLRKFPRNDGMSENVLGTIKHCKNIRGGHLMRYRHLSLSHRKTFYCDGNLYVWKGFLKVLLCCNALPVEHDHHRGTFCERTVHWRASFHIGLGWIRNSLTATPIRELHMADGAAFSLARHHSCSSLPTLKEVIKKLHTYWTILHWSRL